MMKRKSLKARILRLLLAVMVVLVSAGTWIGDDTFNVWETITKAFDATDTVTTMAKAVDNTVDDAVETGEKAANVSDTIESLDDLKNIENFKNKRVLEHIFKGNINGRGKATGYHYEGYEDSPGKVIPGTCSEPDDLGVYKAKVEVDGIVKSGNKGYSTFFPKDMSPQEIVDSINEAYNERIDLGGDLFEGEASNGLIIQMYLEDEKITTAYPIFQE